MDDLTSTNNSKAMSNENEGYESLDDVPFADGVDDDSSETKDVGLIPYMSIYGPAEGFKSDKRTIFIPNVPIRVRIVKYDRNVTKHLLNPYLYTIELEHGPFVWTIYKRYKHFFYLHQQLKLSTAALSLPLSLPFKNSARENNTEETEEDGTKKKRTGLPRFPLLPEIMVGYDDVEGRAKELEEYLEGLLKIPYYRKHHETALFLESSNMSFVSDLGIKSIEGYVKKQTGSTQRGCCCGFIECATCLRLSQICSDLCGCWRQRWLVLKDTWVGYIRPRDSALRGVILFDQSFEISLSMLSSFGIQMHNSQRRIVMKANGRRRRTDVCQAIKNVASRQGYGFTQSNENSSFAPPRSNTMAAWFVDGSAYMSAVADAIMAAKEEIFIADWWLSPEVYLKRPALHETEWRLDHVLKKKAEEGVKVFVLLYKEVEMALGLNSYYSKTRLVQHKNIKVLRHPDHAHTGVFLWAHHEKIVCVDQNYAFLGGIDLCYGRWDDSEHRLVDLGSYYLSGDHNLKKKITSSRPLGAAPKMVAALIQKSNTIGVSTATFPITETPEVTEDVLDKTTTEIEETLVGLEHYKGDSPEFKRKSIFRKLQDTVQESRKSLISMVTGDPPEAVEEPVKVEEVKESENFPSFVRDVGDGLGCAAKYWFGKDYCNFIVKDFSDLDSPYKDLVDRNTTPRMPWHDIGVMVHGAAARDVARHFIQRWNGVKLEKAKKANNYPYLTPKSYENFEEAKRMGDGTLFPVKCQVIRSVSSWSAGFLDADLWEESIHEAYVTSISKAEHYIYIENQFYISLARTNPHVKNQIGEALFKRIMRAHREGKVFRVFVVLPLLPGFEGEVGGASGTALHAITHWNYSSICRGPDSLIARLLHEGVEKVDDYITFHGLRNHSILHGEPVTELIYVHSKLMIIDDRLVICGSANINDRSLLGRRDSEIAVIIKDEELREGTMNGEPASIGLYASNLRKQLFAEHLGLLLPGRAGTVDLSDPVADSFYRDVWLATSKTNTSTFEEVFRCLPSDQATSFKGLQEFNAALPLTTTDPSSAAAKITEIKGHLVDMPLHFLEEEILTPGSKTMEGMMPTTLWT